MTFLHRRIDQFADLLALHRARPERYPFLLETVSQHQPMAPAPDAGTGADQNDQPCRWDILFAFPGQRLLLDAQGRCQWQGQQGDEPISTPPSNDFLTRLDTWWQQESSAKTCSDGAMQSLPFQGGWFLYLGYELAAQIEPVLRLARTKEAARSQRPQAMAVRCPAAILRDHERQCTVLVAEATAAGAEQLDIMAADLQALTVHAHADESARTIIIDDFQEAPEQAFLKAVDRIKAYIKEGDVFQVNLSRRWQGRLPAATTVAELYQALRHHNPAPFAGLCVQNDWAIISSSPERLVAVDAARRVETRPIAGTHPRHADRVMDQQLSQALMQHPKERAEHIMLIDMERNDLGRVCQAGTIEVNELMVLESYAHVHHIVSNVRGHLRDDVSPGDVIRAVFPGGTITGCPKVRCMEIIAELEQHERGPYTGSMGYLNRDGSMDLNILIRTLVLDGDVLSLRAGAGIVTDSDPERELAETRSKARGLLRALGLATETTSTAMS